MDQQLSAENDEKEKLLWKNRELALRTRVLRTQLAVAVQSREAGRAISRATSDSIKSVDDDQHHQLRLNLEKLYQERREQLKQLNKRLEFAKQKILSRTRRMLHDIWDVYPIVEFPDGRGYSICDIHLPSSDNLDGHDETMVSVAIGYVGHLLLLLSDILDITLRFPLKYFGSKSHIFCNRKNQLFPLYIDSFKSRDYPNFSYGMNLLNLDLVQIRTLYGLTTSEADETLANLHGLKQALSEDIQQI